MQDKPQDIAGGCSVYDLYIFSPGQHGIHDPIVSLPSEQDARVKLNHPLQFFGGKNQKSSEELGKGTSGNRYAG